MIEVQWLIGMAMALFALWRAAQHFASVYQQRSW